MQHAWAVSLCVCTSTVLLLLLLLLSKAHYTALTKVGHSLMVEESSVPAR